MSVFKRNLTSEIIQNSASKIIKKYKIKSSLEIGCGDFNISGSLKKIYPKVLFAGSDISKKAVNLSLKKYPHADIRAGSLFKPWVGHKFDLIISDVSAINDVAAINSNWYKGIKCNTGLDGLKNVHQIVSKARNFMNKNGIFIMPLISLSDIKTHKSLLKQNFKKITFSKKVEWPLPKKIAKSLINSKINNDFYDIKEVFGVYIAYTYSVICKL